MFLSAFPVSDPPDIDPLELYAAAIDTSDYVSRVAPQVRRLVPEIRKLLDVGAGGGQLGASLQDHAFPWSAIEPWLDVLETSVYARHRVNDGGEQRHRMQETSPRRTRIHGESPGLGESIVTEKR